MELEQEGLLQWLDRGWNGKTDGVDPIQEERMWVRGAMLEWVKVNYPKYRAQQKNRVEGQGKLF